MARVHLKDIPAGNLVEFEHSAIAYIKVETYNGRIGVVDAYSGRLILFEDLAHEGLTDLVEDVTDQYGFIDPEDPIDLSTVEEEF